MNRDLLKYAGIGAVLTMLAVAVLLFVTRGSHIEIKGSIQKVRVQAMDSKSCVVIVDFHFVNPADYLFIVANAVVYLETKDGERLEGTAVAADSADKLLAYYSKINPDLGPKYNDTLKIRDRINPGESMDRMICARFEIPAAEAEARKRVILRIQDVDRAVSEIVEKRD